MNGKCYCGAPNCIGTLFPRIIREDQGSDDEGGNEAEAHNDEPGHGGEGMEEGDEIADEGREAIPMDV